MISYTVLLRWSYLIIYIKITWVDLSSIHLHVFKFLGIFTWLTLPLHHPQPRHQWIFHVRPAMVLHCCQGWWLHRSALGPSSVVQWCPSSLVQGRLDKAQDWWKKENVWKQCASKICWKILKKKHILYHPLHHCEYCLAYVAKTDRQTLFWC